MEFLGRLALDEVERCGGKQLDLRLRRGLVDTAKTLESFDFSFNPTISRAAIYDLAERRLRRSVRWRNGSFGSDSPNGSRFVERILYTVATLSAQQRNILDFLMSAHVNHVAGLPVPPLLPPHADPA